MGAIDIGCLDVLEGRLRILIGCFLLCAVGATAVAAGSIVRSDGVDIHSGPWHMRVTALADDIPRVRAAADEDLPEDASWAVSQQMRGRSIHVSASQDIAGAEFHTAALSVRIERSPLRIVVSDLQGHVISADTATQAIEAMGSGFMLRKALTQKEHIFGLGDKTGPLDRRGQAFTLWNAAARHAAPDRGAGLCTAFSEPC
ncbi:MAG: DUF4968 domain-containing protein [Pseudomonadota bacterium]|nr:DUF4968 domain-containing protein [Pseudomonadota bacterium]